MFADFTRYGGKCSCGREHTMVTKAAVIEPGCLKNIEKYMDAYGVDGKRCALYGENSYRAVADRRPKAEQEIVLKAEGLHANELSTAEVLSRLDEDIEVIIAVGSGTIHDISRFVAHERGIRFVSCPTAASVDGFCSTVAAMTWYGFKKTMAAVAPEIVIADTDIIKNAPPELVKSGVGDIMAKYTALCDWKISSLVTGEYLCEQIYNIMKEATDSVMKSIPGIMKGEDQAYINVTYALLMSGVAMQMMGNSRPASGAEHHFSHLIEMGPEKLNVRFPALHGEKTGVGSVIASREYERLAEIEDIAPFLKPYAAFPEDKLTEFLGARLAPAVLEENTRDCLAAVTPEKLAENWQEIRKLILAMPGSAKLLSLLREMGAKCEPEDIGVSTSDVDTILQYSPMVRNRLTLMRMRRMISSSAEM